MHARILIPITIILVILGGVLGFASTHIGPPAPAVTGTLRSVHSPGRVTDDEHLTIGQCHFRQADGRQTLPDLGCTPGGYDPAVTQNTIHSTICVRGWTATVRPSTAQTSASARKARAAYGAGYPSEYDHLIPLELGGSNSTSNLWPEPGSIPNPKDLVENELKRRVCSGSITLNSARVAIAADWTTALSKAH